MWITTGYIVIGIFMLYWLYTKVKQYKVFGDEMISDDQPANQIVFMPSQCEAEVNELVEKFTGVESNLDLSELKTLIDSQSSDDRMTTAIEDLKLQMVISEQQPLRELSVEEYVVEIEGAMRDYVQVIITASQQGHDAVNKTEKVLEQIDSIFGLVDGLRHVADQTGLLALNAAIEAARIGTVGRTYSYMAKEVQRLSIQSDTFGGDIKREMQKAKTSVETTTAMVEHIVVSDLQIALETRSGIDQLIGQLQGLAVLDTLGFSKTEVYGKIISEMHKIVVVVFMKIDLIQRLGLVDSHFKSRLQLLADKLQALYLSKVIKK